MACACCQSGLCACGDTCVYAIEQVSPISVKHSRFSCFNPVSSQVTASSLIKSLLPFTISGEENFPQTANRSVSVSSNTGSSIGVQNTHSANGFTSIPGVASNRFSGGSNAGIAVACIFNQDFIRRFSVSLSCTARGQIYFSSGGQTVTTGFWERTYSGQFEIPSTCISGQGKICQYFGQEVQQMTTPLTITLSSGTSSLGSLALTVDSGYGEDLQSAKSAVDAILAGLSYEVIITARQSCNEAP